MPYKKNKNSDSVYFLKLVLYMIIGAQWVKIITASGTQIPIPLGAIIGLLFAMHEHFKIDRRIEFAVLIIAMFIGFWVPIGLEITLP